MIADNKQGQCHQITQADGERGKNIVMITTKIKKYRNVV